jgi:NADH:ubiquinone oxidoreductase subunit 6 (subunit J)
MSQSHLRNAFVLLGADDSSSPGAALGDFVRTFWPILVPLVLGFGAVYLLLPRARSYPPLGGALCGAAALVLGGWGLIHAEPDLAETILFYAFSAVAIVGGVLLITLRNPVKAALSFALVVLSSCGLFLLQAAPFLMAATIIIYAGAIIVTFLFVLMLAQQVGLSDADQRSREPLLATVAGFVLLGGLLCVLHLNYGKESLAVLDPLDELTEQAGRAARAGSTAEMKAILGEPDEFCREFRRRINTITSTSSAARKAIESVGLEAAIDDANQALNAEKVSFKDKAERLRTLFQVGRAVRSGQGSLKPSGVNHPLSGYSGLRPNLPAGKVPTDDRGRPVMPAQNLAALGKSLFTDYVLAVELAGTLLLVATIGAIAIAGRRPEGLR